MRSLEAALEDEEVEEMDMEGGDGERVLPNPAETKSNVGFSPSQNTCFRLYLF